MPQPQNIIGIAYDFDRTLSPHSMQEDTVLPHLGLDPQEFWLKVNSLVQERYYESELAWMRLLLENRGFRQLSNRDLKQMGRLLQYYPGVPEVFSELTQVVSAPEYQEYGVSIEHYVITSGLREVLEGSTIRPHVKEVFGSEFDEDDGGKLFFPKRAVGHTQKTQYLFRINKGPPYLDLNKDVNDHVPDDEKRIPFWNMIYIGDGPTDVPCFAVVTKEGGVALAVYDPGNEESFEKGMQLSKANRVHELEEADYRATSQLRRKLEYKVREIASRICQEQQRQREASVIRAPQHR